MPYGAPVQGEPFEWIRWMFRASLLLAAGSLLLLGPLTWAMRGFVGSWDLIMLSIFAHLAVIVHSVGWGALAAAVYGARGDPSVGLLPRAMQGAFVASLVAFVLGIVTLPWTVPGPCGWFGECWTFVLFAWLFPYVPSIYGPVVALHAVIFLAGEPGLRDHRSRAMGRVASYALLAVVGAGIPFQSVLSGRPLPLPFALDILGFSLPGLTSLAYGLLAFIWRREYLGRRGVRRADLVSDYRHAF